MLPSPAATTAAAARCFHPHAHPSEPSGLEREDEDADREEDRKRGQPRADEWLGRLSRLLLRRGRRWRRRPRRAACLAAPVARQHARACWRGAAANSAALSGRGPASWLLSLRLRATSYRGPAAAWGPFIRDFYRRGTPPGMQLQVDGGAGAARGAASNGSPDAVFTRDRDSQYTKYRASVISECRIPRFGFRMRSISPY